MTGILSCNGSDGFLAWIDNVLEIRQTANYDMSDIDFDVRMYDTPNQVRVRNEMIVSDVKKSIALKQTPAILTRFKEHAKLLYDTLKVEADHVFLLYGDNSDKENADIRVRHKADS